MKLYQKLDIPNIDEIVGEILKFVKPQVEQNLRYWDVGFIEFSKHTPTFFKYIGDNFYRMPHLCRFYNTPPFGRLVAHIDDSQTAKNNLGFNIPLSGTSNTEMNYYDSPLDNLELFPTVGFGARPAQLIKDHSKLVFLDRVVIDKPTLLRTDVIHEVVNNNDSYRLVLGMKFIANTFEELYKFNDH